MSNFLQLFAEKFTKTPKHGSFLEKLQVLAKSMIFRAFSRNEPLFATFSWKVDQNAETWLFPRKVASFGQMDDFSAKSEWFREKARKIIDLAKTNNFSSKLPCLGVLVSFSAKSCKKWLISRKTTKNHPFGQNLQLFEETTMFRRFGQLFSKKLQKVAHFEKMHEKSSIWPKLATLRGNYHVSAFCWTFQQKVSHFVKKHEKSSIWPKLTTSRANYHVWAFWWAFQQKVAKSGSFLEKQRKIIHLAKTCNFSRKLPCFGVLVNFSAKSCKK